MLPRKLIFNCNEYIIIHETRLKTGVPVVHNTSYRLERNRKYQNDAKVYSFFMKYSASSIDVRTRRKFNAIDTILNRTFLEAR